MSSTTKPMTAKAAATHVRPIRSLISVLGTMGLLPADKAARKLQALEYIEATLVAQRASGKSGLKAGVEAGFVPYAER